MLLICSIARADTSRARQPTYLLWGVLSLGVSDRAAELVRSMLEGELHRSVGGQLITQPEGLTDEVRQLVDACGGTTECIAEAGGALGVDRIIFGVVTSIGDLYNLKLKLIDVHSHKDISKAGTSFDGERSKMLEAMQVLLFELIDPARLKGFLALELPLDGATVFVDSLEVGHTPLPAPITVEAGEHSLKITSPLMKDYFTFFTVYHEKTTTVRVDAEKVQALQAQLEAAVQVPIYKKWWFWAATTVGVGVAAGAGFYLAESGKSGAPPATLGTLDMSATGTR